MKPKKTKKETKQRKTKKEKITLRLIPLINMDIRPLNKILALIQQYIKMIIYCCCSVAKSCPTLCNPIDCNMPELPVPNHFLGVQVSDLKYIYAQPSPPSIFKALSTCKAETLHLLNSYSSFPLLLSLWQPPFDYLSL